MITEKAMNHLELIASSKWDSSAARITSGAELPSVPGTWSSSGPAMVPGRKDLQGGTFNSGSVSWRCPYLIYTDGSVPQGRPVVPRLCQSTTIPKGSVTIRKPKCLL